MPAKLNLAAAPLDRGPEEGYPEPSGVKRDGGSGSTGSSAERLTGRREMHLQRVATVLAWLSSVVTFAAITSLGLFLLLVESSGERFTGLLLVLAGSAAFLCALFLLLARSSFFRGTGGRAAGISAMVLACAPVAALGAAALAFAGIPVGSRLPAVDWTAFSVGVVLLVGSLAIVGRGIQRIGHANQPKASPLPQQIRRAQLHLRAVLEPEDEPAADFQDEDIRVTRVDPVDLPSLSRFRSH